MLILTAKAPLMPLALLPASLLGQLMLMLFVSVFFPTNRNCDRICRVSSKYPRHSFRDDIWVYILLLFCIHWCLFPRSEVDAAIKLDDNQHQRHGHISLVLYCAGINVCASFLSEFTQKRQLCQIHLIQFDMLKGHIQKQTPNPPHHHHHYTDTVVLGRNAFPSEMAHIVCLANVFVLI